jgi:hypothetical protein
VDAADISIDVSEFRIEKQRAEATLTLTTGTSVTGCFFLSTSSASHAGPERVADLLNGDAGFFPFELNCDKAPYTVLYNRTHIVQVSLLGDTLEPQLAPGYNLATERAVRVILSNGNTVKGRVRVYRPNGRDRLSDYAREPELFRYIETADGTVIVNANHIVELRETTEA